MIALSDISRIFIMGDQEVRALNHINLTINAGEYVSVMGPSGSGKSTLLNIIGLLDQPSSGAYHLETRDVTALTEAEQAKVRRERIGFIFQAFHLVPRLTAAENIELPLILEGLPPIERQARVKAALEQTDLIDRAHHRPAELSGGQRQRVAIARALAVNPRLIVCDEPTSALDVSVQAQILNLLKDLQDRLGLAYLFITHNISVVEFLAQEVAVMYLGRIVETGPVEQVLRAPRHPYTQALLSAVPTVEKESGRTVIRLTGELPSPANPPKGCHFHPRCMQAMAVCREVYPEAREWEGRQLCCHLYDEKP